MGLILREDYSQIIPSEYLRQRLLGPGDERHQGVDQDGYREG